LKKPWKINATSNKFLVGFNQLSFSVLDKGRCIRLKRLMWSNLLLGFWLMISPFVFMFLNPRIFRVLWKDMILGFGIATFALCRVLSRRGEQIAIADWLVTALGVITLINPILYSYYNFELAVWNNLAVGAAVFLLAIYQDWQDFHGSLWHNRHHGAH
jgi:hypothetical protein